MNQISQPFVIGFAESCRRQGLSVKAAAALLWRTQMTRLQTPAFLEGVKSACESHLLPLDLPVFPVVKGAAVDREFIKAARMHIQDLDEKMEAAVGPLKTAFARRRNDIQLTLNAHILGEA